MKNLAHEWVLAQGKDVEGCREEYDGACIDFAGDFLDSTGRGRMAYFDNIGSSRWRYHAAVEIDGFIHDLWFDLPMPTSDFLEALGGGEVDYPLENKTP